MAGPCEIPMSSEAESFLVGRFLEDAVLEAYARGFRVRVVYTFPPREKVFSGRPRVMWARRVGGDGSCDDKPAISILAVYDGAEAGY